MQMCIFVGHQRAGWLGGLIAGVAFMAPAFAIVLALSAIASAYGALPFMRDAFYGLGPVVLGVFAVAVYRLGVSAIKGVAAAVIAAVAGVAAFFSLIGIAGIFVLAGCVGVALYHSRRAGLIAALIAAGLIAAERIVEPMLMGLGAGVVAGQPALWEIGAFFLKVGAVTFGGGMTIIVFVQDQVVNHLQWISAQQFIECLTLAQFTPGPIIMVAAYIGYMVAGVAGAAVAGAAIFLPSFVLMLSILPWLERVRRVAWVKAGIKGISPAVLGAIAVSMAHLAPHAASDAFRAGLLVLTVVVLLAWRPSILSLVAGGGVIGLLARSRFIFRLRELV
jgi:chromate transporter